MFLAVHISSSASCEFSLAWLECVCVCVRQYICVCVYVRRGWGSLEGGKDTDVALYSVVLLILTKQWTTVCVSMCNMCSLCMYVCMYVKKGQGVKCLGLSLTQWGFRGRVYSLLLCPHSVCVCVCVRETERGERDREKSSGRMCTVYLRVARICN